MIVRTLDDIKQSGGYAEKPGTWTSTRYLLSDDNVGFTVTQTTFTAGQSLEMEYKNHIEANLIIEGQARVTDVASRKEYMIGPGDIYTLDKHDRHILEAISDLRIVCIFTPALTGKETHDADGSYPIL